MITLSNCLGLFLSIYINWFCYVWEWIPSHNVVPKFSWKCSIISILITRDQMFWQSVFWWQIPTTQTVFWIFLHRVTVVVVSPLSTRGNVVFWFMAWPGYNLPSRRQTDVLRTEPMGSRVRSLSLSNYVVNNNVDYV